MSDYRKADGFEQQKMIVLTQDQIKTMLQHRLLQELYVTDLGYFPNALHHYRERPQGNEGYIIIYCANGKGRLSINEHEKYHIASNDLVIIPSGTPHQYEANETQPWSIYWFHIGGNAVGELFQTSELASYVQPLQAGDAEAFIRTFHTCYDLLSSRINVQGLIHVSHALRFLISQIGLSQKMIKDEKTEAYLESAILYMQQRIEQQLSLSELASHIGISRQHLNHIFRKSSETTPIYFFLSLKMQRAWQMLDLTDLSVKEVSTAIGIDDPFYFSRLFKKIIGVSPKSYRNQLRG